MAERKSKTDIIAEVASTTGLTKTDVAEVVDVTLDTIQKWVAIGDEVVLTGFGNFKKKVRSARKGRNPHTGATIDIPESKTPKFAAGKAFKDIVNEKN